MGIIAWIALGLAAGLLAIMLLPGQKPRGPNFRLPDLLHRGAGRRWVASLPGARDLVSFSAWLAAIAEAAVLPAPPAWRVHGPLMTTVAELGSFLAREFL